MAIPATETCFSLTPTPPATNDAAGYIAIPDWAVFAETDAIGDQTDTREVTTKTDLCSGTKRKSAGAIDYGSIELTLAYSPTDAAQLAADAQFLANTVVYGRKILSNGNKRFYEMIVSSRTEAQVDGDEVIRSYVFDISNKIEDNT